MGDAYTIASIALVLSAVCLFICGAGLLLILALLHPNDERYADVAGQVDQLRQMMDHSGKAQSDLYRYVEAIDEATAGTGHRVLLPRMSTDPTSSVHTG